MKLRDIKNTKAKRVIGNIEGLRQSIADVGLINPLTIDQDGNLLAGGRRYQAIRELGWQEVEVKVIPIYGNQLKAFKVALDENLKRKPLTDPECRALIAEYDELKRRLEGEADRYSHPKAMPQSSIGWKQSKTAKDLGISRQAVSEAIQAENIAKEYPEWADKKTKQVIRLDKIERQREVIAKLKKPTGLYDVLVVDPPWQIAGEYDPDGRRAIPPYPTMSFQQISEIELPANDQCVLWLWVTNQNIHDGFHLLEIWGFEFRNILTWCKQSFGIGSWLRNQTEHCLLATKGHPLFDGSSTPTVLFAGRKAHSVKPDAFYELVSKICMGRKLDYFAGKQREGWDCYSTTI